VQFLAAKTGSRVQISDARAANLLGLSDQVPAQLVYLTDGPAHRVKIGAQTIQLKPARPSRFPGAGTPAGLALQRGSAEVFGSEPNASAVLSYCLAMSRWRFRFYEPQRNASAEGYLYATHHPHVTTSSAIHFGHKRPYRGCVWPATDHRVRESNPSSGPRRLVSTPAAVHLLPSEKAVTLAGRERARPRPSAREGALRPTALSPGRGWLAAGAFTSRGETREGPLPGLFRLPDDRVHQVRRQSNPHGRQTPYAWNRVTDSRVGHSMSGDLMSLR
jgi:hypothetical protein